MGARTCAGRWRAQIYGDLQPFLASCQSSRSQATVDTAWIWVPKGVAFSNSASSHPSHIGWAPVEPHPALVVGSGAAVICGPCRGSGVHPAHGSSRELSPAALGLSTFLTLGVRWKVHSLQKRSPRKGLTQPNEPCMAQLSPLPSGTTISFTTSYMSQQEPQGWPWAAPSSIPACSPGTDPQHNLLPTRSFPPHYPGVPGVPHCQPCSKSFSELCFVKSFLFPARKQVEGGI